MCLGYEGTLAAVEGDGVTRRGVLVVGDRRFDIGLGFVPDAEVGDMILAHSGQGVRVVSSSSTKLIERA
jgi:hydrogenase maturation factor